MVSLFPLWIFENENYCAIQFSFRQLRTRLAFKDGSREQQDYFICFMGYFLFESLTGHWSRNQFFVYKHFFLNDDFDAILINNKIKGHIMLFLDFLNCACKQFQKIYYFKQLKFQFRSILGEIYVIFVPLFAILQINAHCCHGYTKN